MVFDLKRLSRLSPFYWAAIFFGLTILVLVLASPRWELDRASLALRLNHLASGFTPPLGLKARLVLALIGGGLMAVSIAVPYALFSHFAQKRRAARFQAHPAFETHNENEVEAVEPSRRPIFAGQELGAPLMSDEVLEKARSGEAEWPVGTEAQDAHLDTQPKPETLSEPMVAALAPVAEAVMAHDSPAPNPKPEFSAKTSGYEGLSLQEMIARLEAGLATRSPTPPTSPAAQAVPSFVAEVPVALPLSIVPNRPHSMDDPTIQDAMNTLGRLVSRAS